MCAKKSCNVGTLLRSSTGEVRPSRSSTTYDDDVARRGRKKEGGRRGGVWWLWGGRGLGFLIDEWEVVIWDVGWIRIRNGSGGHRTKFKVQPSPQI